MKLSAANIQSIHAKTMRRADAIETLKTLRAQKSQLTSCKVIFEQPSGRSLVEQARFPSDLSAGVLAAVETYYKGVIGQMDFDLAALGIELEDVA